MAICRMCGQDKSLIKAHIIPKAFYPPRSPLGDTIIVPGLEGGYARRAPIGVYDENILCAECDGKLGQLDQHVAEKVLRGRAQSTYNLARAYPDADPVMVLKFAASVLWRATITSHDMFGGLKKIEADAALVREWLLGTNDVAPVEGWLAEFETDRVPFLNPAIHDFSGVRVIVIYASRLIFYVKLDDKPIVEPEIRQVVLTPMRPVRSIVRQFPTSQEAAIMARMLFGNPAMAKVRARWHRGSGKNAKRRKDK